MEKQTKQNEIPDLGGIITTNDLYKKGRFTYSAWAKTAQRIREISFKKYKNSRRIRKK